MACQRSFIIVLAAFLLLPVLANAYDISMLTDKFVYAANDTIYLQGSVRVNNTGLENATVAFSYSGGSSYSSSFVTNTTGGFNYTFSLSVSGTYTIVANYSGDYVTHTIKVKPYKFIVLKTDKSTYTTGDNGTLTIIFTDANGAGVSGQTVTPLVHYANNTVYSATISPSSAATDASGKAAFTFLVPSSDGEYIFEVNSYEAGIKFVVGGFEPSMKVSPAITAPNNNITIKIAAKTPTGNGISVSGQIIITAPNNTQITITSLTPYNDTGGATVTGVYENIFTSANIEGEYKVKASITQAGSNLTRDLYSTFEIKAYMLEVLPRTTVNVPGATVTFDVKLRNTSSNDLISGKLSDLQKDIKVYDSNSIQLTSVSPSIATNPSDTSRYVVTAAMPTGLKSGSYSLVMGINDSYGTGRGTGYFTIQAAKPEVSVLNQFNGTFSKTFLSGKQLVVKVGALNASGYVNVTSVAGYSVEDEFGNDYTSQFLDKASYTALTGSAYFGYVNMTTPRSGGRYIIKVKANTDVGVVSAETWVFVKVFDITVRPTMSGIENQNAMMGFGGPGYMFAFKSNETVRFNVTVVTASEEQGESGMKFGMGGGGMPGGGMGGGGGGPRMESGMGGMSSGSTVSGATVNIYKVININTEEDVTSSVTVTKGVTDTNGKASVTVKPNTNSGNWSGGYYVVFLNVSSTSNQTDRTEGFFEIRRYFVNVWVQNPACTGNNNFMGGGGYVNCWNIGPNDNVNVTVKIIEPGSWNMLTAHGNVTILGMYYTGSMGEFVFPPKKIEGTNATCRITANGECSALVNVSGTPNRRWKSGFYEVRVQVNTSGGSDAGNGFMSSKVYEGWASTVNNVTGDYDYTTNTNDNPKFAINVYDVQNHGPAANVTIEFRSIMSMTTFPPSEYSYTHTINNTITNSQGVAYITLPAPAAGWQSGDYFVIFNARDSIGNNSDTVQGWFQVREFFVSMQPSSWQYRRNSTVTINVTLSSDPPWMMQSMGTYASAGGNQRTFEDIDITAFPDANNNSYKDIDGDAASDINITWLSMQEPVINITPYNASAYVITFMGCTDWSESCNWQKLTFDSYSCNANAMNAVAAVNRTSANNSINFSSGRLFCINATNGRFYRLQSDGGNNTSWRLKLMEDTGVQTFGGNAIVQTNASAGFSYFTGNLKSIKVCTFDWQTGESCLTEGVHYNVTTANGQKKGSRNVTIPGIGSFRIVPNGNWPGSGDSWYTVMTEFNTTPGNGEKGFSGFSIISFYAWCYRQSWGSLRNGDSMPVICNVQDPQTWGPYATPVDAKIISITNSQTGTAVTDGWATTIGRTNSTSTQLNFTLNQSLNTGTYNAIVRINDSSASKDSWLWFEVKDFDSSFWSERWSYTSTDNVSIIAEGWSGEWPSRQSISVNVSGSPVIYRYDRTTWSKSLVSGAGISWSIANHTEWGNSRTRINITNSGGWQEGQYEVQWYLQRMDGTGGTVPVSTWFEIKAFEVNSWIQTWSVAPNDNVTINVNVYTAGSWWQAYNGNINVSITQLQCGQWGSRLTLTKGTNYTAPDSVKNPGVSGNPILINITPVTQFPAGNCQASLAITGGSNTVGQDIFFDVVSFYLNSWSERWEYTTGELAAITLSAWKPSGGTINLTGASVLSLTKCTYTSCSLVSTASLNSTYAQSAGNPSSGALRINVTGLDEGWYNGQLRGTDSRGLTADAWFGFRLTDAAFTGSVQNPYNGTNNKWQYYMNDTLLLNITGKPGINVTNATIEYWRCSASGCTQNIFLITIGRNLSSTNMIINITPNMTAGLNNTWITDDWGWGGYNFHVFGRTTDNKTKDFWTYTGVYFPTQWNWTSIEVTPSQAISFSVPVCLDYSCVYPVQGATVNVTNIYYDSWYSTTELNASNWNSTVMATGADGRAIMSVSPNTTVHNWSSSSTIRIRYKITYQNATTMGEKSNIRAKQNLLSAYIQLVNLSNNATITDVVRGHAFYLHVVASNSVSTDANNTQVSITLPISSTNASAVMLNVTPFNSTVIMNVLQLRSNMTNVTAAQWVFNTSTPANYTTTISINPAAEGFVASSTTQTFAVR